MSSHGMDRRGFLASLAAMAAVSGGCRMSPSGMRGRIADAVADGMRPRIADAVADMMGQLDFGCFDCAIAGGSRGPYAAVAAHGSHVDENSLFEIASVSKLFTAAICARLFAQGRLDIDRPVVGEASVRDLATHTSGYTDAWMGKAGVYGSKWPFASDAAYEAAAMSAKPSYAKGSKSVYSCTNMILLGFFLERELGMDLDDAARKLVWKPLGMDSTTWRNVPSSDPRLVRIYTKGPRPLGTKGDENARNFTRPIGNAGVFTSCSDMRLFVSDMLSRRAFERAYYKLMFAPAFEGGGSRRSFGWNMSQATAPEGWSASTICHTGYTGQYVAVDPEDGGRAAIVFTNLKSEDKKIRSESFAGRRRVAALVGC